MFRCTGTASLWLITLVGVVGSVTGLGLSHGGWSYRLACARYAKSGLVFDLRPHCFEAMTPSDTQAAGADVEAGAATSIQRCEPAPGFFATSRVGARDIQYAVGAPTARWAALVARIHVAGARLGVAPHLGEGIAWTESRLDPSARSPDGLSVGAFQLTQATATAMRQRLVGVRKQLSLPLHDEVTLGVGYLSYLSRLFARPTVLDDRGNATTAVSDCAERWRFVIAAYNAGEGRVAAAQGRAAAVGLDPTRFDDVRLYLPRITQRYVDSVLTFAASQIAGRASRAI